MNNEQTKTDSEIAFEELEITNDETVTEAVSDVENKTMLNEDIIEEVDSDSKATKKSKPGRKHAKLEAEINELREVAAEAQDAKLRTLAEFENFRRRSAQELAIAKLNAASHIVEELLPIIDNLERALAHAEESELKKGIEMVFRQMLGILESNNVVEIACEGVYDPNFHQPMMTEESADHQTDEIIEVLQKGYKMNDKVLRFAMVKVAL